MKGGAARGVPRRKGEDRGSKRKQTAVRRERAGKRKKKRHAERKREREREREREKERGDNSTAKYR